MARRLAPPLLWLLALMGAWMLFVVSTELPELMVGAGSALVGAGLVLVLRREVGPHAPPKLRWLARAWVLLPRLFTETAMVFAALFRQLFQGQPAVGAFHATPYGGHFPNEPTAAAADAFAITANSIAPNTIVLDADRVEGVLLVHQLVPQPEPKTRRQLVFPS
jgi:multisubunit Na+/H+ antiporter MnhE subunit